MQVFAPTRLTELEQGVAWAVAEQAPLEVIGLGSKRRLGRPVRAEAELRLDQLGGIAMYEPDELVMSAAAATPLATIEAELAAIAAARASAASSPATSPARAG